MRSRFLCQIIVLGLSLKASAGIGPADQPLQTCLTKMEAAKDVLKATHAAQSFLKIEGSYTERGIHKIGTYYFGSTAWQFLPDGYQFKDVKPHQIEQGQADRNAIQVSANDEARRTIIETIHGVAKDLMDALRTPEGQRDAKSRPQYDKDLIAAALKACDLDFLKRNSYQIKSLYSKSVLLAPPTEGPSGLLKKETDENPPPKGYVSYTELLSGTDYQKSTAPVEQINK